MEFPKNLAFELTCVSSAKSALLQAEPGAEITAQLVMTDPTEAFGHTADGTPIPGRMRRSSRARRISINVRADRVELVVPVRAPLDGPRGAWAFLKSKRAWVVQTWERARDRQREREEARPPPIRYVDGASILHRGEYLALVIRKDDIRKPRVETRDGILVSVPHGLSDEGRERKVALAVRSWAQSELLSEARRLAEDMASRLGLKATDVRLSRARTRWGSCNAKGVIRINVALSAAPPDILEYLVAHEVAHLRCRNHGPRFYTTLARLMPDWEERRRRLRAFEKEHPFLLR